MACRRKFVDADTEREQLLSLKISKKTVYAENSALKALQEFLTSKGLTTKIENLEKPELDSILADFFASLRKGSDYYKRNTYLSMRQSLNRYFKRIHGEGNIDIVNDLKTFPKSNEIFSCLLKKLKIDGFGDTMHYKEIPSEDLKKVTEILDCCVPQQLQWLVFFFIGIFFARRGCENFDIMQKTNIVIQKDQSGKRYISLKKDELTKCRRENNTERGSNGRIYETGSPKCPVKVIEIYLSKLNEKNIFLWQRPKQSFKCGELCWFENKKIGINTFRNFMAKISQFCKLSDIYSNHCLRVTTCTILGEKHEENDIKSVSGHQSSSSLGIYKRIKDSKKETMSLDLSNELGLFQPELPREVVNVSDDFNDVLGDQWLMDEVMNMEGKIEEAKNKTLQFNNCVFNNCSFN